MHWSVLEIAVAGLIAAGIVAAVINAVVERSAGIKRSRKKGN